VRHHTPIPAYVAKHTHVADTVVNALAHSVRAAVTVPVCDVASGCVKVRDTLNEIEEVDFTHGTENDSHAGRRSDW
jgi:hypothetical protein